jgi:hypothetical protein
MFFSEHTAIKHIAINYIYVINLIRNLIYSCWEDGDRNIRSIFIPNNVDILFYCFNMCIYSCIGSRFKNRTITPCKLSGFIGLFLFLHTLAEKFSKSNYVPS